MACTGHLRSDRCSTYLSVMLPSVLANSSCASGSHRDTRRSPLMRGGLLASQWAPSCLPYLNEGEVRLAILTLQLRDTRGRERVAVAIRLGPGLDQALVVDLVRQARQEHACVDGLCLAILLRGDVVLGLELCEPFVVGEHTQREGDVGDRTAEDEDGERRDHEGRLQDGQRVAHARCAMLVSELLLRGETPTCIGEVARSE
mmetsp:Transcript_27854/g.71114  ORF Transcript_27854/g.71114 Transcript_27854/m.71114 type:complete len:202 (+) Transcript_27854:2062-2667(+)